MENKQFNTDKRILCFYNFINKIIFSGEDFLFEFYKNYDLEEKQPNLFKDLLGIYCYNYVDKFVNSNKINEIFDKNKNHKFFVNQIFELISFNLKRISRINGKDFNSMLKLFSNNSANLNMEKENNKILKEIFNNNNIKEFEEKLKKYYYSKKDIEYNHSHSILEDENLKNSYKVKSKSVYCKNSQSFNSKRIYDKSITKIEKDVIDISKENNLENDISIFNSELEMNKLKCNYVTSQYNQKIKDSFINGISISKNNNHVENKNNQNNIRNKSFIPDSLKNKEKSIVDNINNNFDLKYIERHDEDLIKFIATFFMNESGIDMNKLGEYIGKFKEFNKSILKEYINLFDFHNKRIDLALRMVLFNFQIPGEAQIIDRLIDAFSIKYFKDNINSFYKKYLENSDAVYYLSYNTMILHTSLHNPKVNKKEKMTNESFQKNLKNLNNGKNFDDHFLSEIFEDVEKSEFLNSTLAENYSYTSYLELIKIKIFCFKNEEKWKFISDTEYIKISNIILNVIHEKICKDFDILENIQNKDFLYLNNLTNIFYNIINIANAFQMEILKSTTINFWLKLLDFRSLNILTDEKIDLASLYVKSHINHVNLFEFNLGSFIFFLIEKNYIIEKFKEEEKSLNDSFSEKISKIYNVFSPERIDKMIKYTSKFKLVYFNSMLSLIFRNFNFYIEKKGHFINKIFQGIIKLIISYEKKDIKTWEIIWINILHLFEFLKGKSINYAINEVVLKNYFEVLIKNYIRNLINDEKIENELNLFSIFLYLMNNFNNYEIYNSFILKSIKMILRENQKFFRIILKSKVIPLEIRKSLNEKTIKEFLSVLKIFISKNMAKINIFNLRFSDREFKELSFLLIIDINLLMKVIEELINTKINKQCDNFYLSSISIENNNKNIEINSKENNIYNNGIISFKIIIKILKEFILLFFKIQEKKKISECELEIINLKFNKENYLNLFVFNFTNLFKYFLTQLLNTQNTHLVNEFILEFLEFFLYLNESHDTSFHEKELFDNDFIKDILILILETLEFHNNELNSLNSKILLSFFQIADKLINFCNKNSLNIVILIYEIILLFLNNSKLQITLENEFMIKFFNLFQKIFCMENRFIQQITVNDIIDENEIKNMFKEDKMILDLKILYQKISINDIDRLEFSSHQENFFFIIINKVKNKYFPLIEKLKIFTCYIYDTIEIELEIKCYLNDNEKNLDIKKDIQNLYKFSLILNYFIDFYFDNLTGKDLIEYFKSNYVNNDHFNTSLSKTNSSFYIKNPLKKNDFIFDKKFKTNFAHLIINLNNLTFFIVLNKFIISSYFLRINQNKHDMGFDIDKTLNFLFDKIELFIRIIFIVNEEKKFNEYLNVNLRNEMTNLAKILLRSTNNFINLLSKNTYSFKENCFIKSLKFTLIESIIIDSKEIRFEIKNLLCSLEKYYA